MQGRKLIAGFLARLVVVYALLLIAWLGVGRLYGSSFCVAGNIIFSRLGDRCSAQFERAMEATATGADLDITLHFLKRTHTGQPEVTAELPISSRYLGYFPTAIFIALICATPLERRRRLKALGWGLILVQGYIALRVGLVLFGVFAEPTALAIFASDAAWVGVMRFIAELLGKSMTGCWIGPIVIWILVSFRNGDWEILTGTMRKVEANRRRHMV